MKAQQDEERMREAWLKRLGLEPHAAGEAAGGRFPFSMTLNGEPCRENVSGWQRTTEPPGGNTWSVAWFHERTGLRVRATVRTFPDSPAVDYVLHVTNTAHGDSPPLEAVLPLDAQVAPPAKGPVCIHHARGSACADDDFLPLQTRLFPGARLRLASEGGRSSNGVLPFFNIAWPGGGAVLAVGWTGQWQVTFERGGRGRLRLTAGLQETRFRLHPGETIRTPRIVLLPWLGEDRFRGHNLFRRLMLRHYLPRRGGEVALPPISHNTASALLKAGVASNEANQLHAIARCAELGLEAYWLDAYWFPQPWWQNVGNWTPRLEDFPRGLRVLSDAAHAAGMRFVLWYEPERVFRGTSLHREHPEFLLSRDEGDVFLFNLGDPKARAYMTDFISEQIEAFGIDIYRQDFNMDPLPYWRANDAPDRVGLTETRYVEGLYAFWSELRRRHPEVLIDNCASGGRRIDVETCALSVPLWRSDFPDVADRNAEYRRVVDIANQVEHAGLSLFVPLHAGPVSDPAPYSFRSALATGVCFYSDICRRAFPDALARRGADELRELRPLMLGDFFPLTPVTADSHQWFAVQYDRPDLRAGFALYFRRKHCPTPCLAAALRALSPRAAYRVSLAPSFERNPPQEMSGADLASLVIRADEAPAAVLLRYEVV